MPAAGPSAPVGRRGQAGKRGIQVGQVQPDCPLFVHPDLTRLKQIFLNLLSKAIKPNRVGSIEDGTGIGLVVSRPLVALLAGAISVESNEGVGSVFWIELSSVDAGESAANAHEPAAPKFATPPSGAPLRHRAVRGRQPGQAAAGGASPRPPASGRTKATLATGAATAAAA